MFHSYHPPYYRILLWFLFLPSTTFKKGMLIYTRKPHHQTLVWNNTFTGYVWIWKQFLLPQPKIYCAVKKQNSLWLSILWADQRIEKVIFTFKAATILSWSLIYNFVILISISQLMCVSKEICKMKNPWLWNYLNYLLWNNSLWKLESWFSFHIHFHIHFQN